MNQQLKKRLVGAIVLIALAAIFIPMLFNSGDKSEIPTFGSNVPAKPESQFQTIEVPLQIPPPQNIETRPVETQKEAVAAESKAQAVVPVAAPPAPAETPASTLAPILLPSPAAPAITPASGNEKRPTQQPHSVAAPKPAPATKQATASPSSKSKSSDVEPASTKPASGWAVQLGSFGKSANALALRNKLRRKGYAAFVEQQKGSSGTSYRVRVGPELKRESADALKAKLEKAGFKGVVMSHP